MSLSFVDRSVEVPGGTNGLVIRYGGDEFLILLPETNGESTAAAERICEAIARQNEENPLVEFPLTLAIGTSYWDPAREKSLEAILREVDERMYEDKRKQTENNKPG